MTNLRYSSERPTTEGFYFVKCRKLLGDGLYETVVHVYSRGIFCDGDNFSRNEDRFVAFAGPIPPPEGGELFDTKEKS